MSTQTTPRLLRSLGGEALDRPPIWFMRQAGRFLPEYRALRATTTDFISFCLNPEKAAEATLQPVRRFPFDAAIVFADILLIPRALGQEVWFEVGEGPRLGLLPEPEGLAAQIGNVVPALSNVGETLSRVRAELEPERALIGFAGAPWTVLTYMIEGRSTDRSAARSMAYTQPERVKQYLDVLVEASALYMQMQVKAGAQVLQIFESWAEGLSEPLFEALVMEPHQKLLARLSDLGVTVPVIGFPRGAGALADRYAAEVNVAAVGLDTQATLQQGCAIQTKRTIQGALDPLLLRAGGRALDERVDSLISAWGRGPYIFNLGHGIIPDTPVSHVKQVVERVTGESVSA